MKSAVPIRHKSETGRQYAFCQSSLISLQSVLVVWMLLLLRSGAAGNGRSATPLFQEAYTLLVANHSTHNS